MSFRAREFTVPTFPGQTTPYGQVNIVNVMSSQSVNYWLFLGRLLHVAKSTLLMSFRASQFTVPTFSGQIPTCGRVNIVNVISSQSFNNWFFLDRLLHVTQSTLLMSYRASQFTVLTFPGQTPPCAPVNIVNVMSRQSVYSTDLSWADSPHVPQSTQLMSCRASQLTTDFSWADSSILPSQHC